MPGTRITLDEAVELTRTGDIWLFRGRTPADRAIQVTTNSPVNHVGMSVVLEDLPPLMWHAELGRSLPDMWTGTHQRGVQLHDLRKAVVVWGNRYGQRAWLRQLWQPVTKEMEDAVLRTVARLDGTPFPSTARLAGRWLHGRLPRLRRGAPVTDGGAAANRGPADRGPADRGAAATAGAATARAATAGAAAAELETAYCAEVVAITYEAMGLLPSGRRRTHWYDAGRFWSGDDLRLAGDARLGGEIAVQIPRS